MNDDEKYDNYPQLGIKLDKTVHYSILYRPLYIGCDEFIFKGTILYYSAGDRMIFYDDKNYRILVIRFSQIIEIRPLRKKEGE